MWKKLGNIYQLKGYFSYFFFVLVALIKFGSFQTFLIFYRVLLNSGWRVNDFMCFCIRKTRWHVISKGCFVFSDKLYIACPNYDVSKISIPLLQSTWNTPAIRYILHFQLIKSHQTPLRVLILFLQQNLTNLLRPWFIHLYTQTIAVKLFL